MGTGGAVRCEDGLGRAGTGGAGASGDGRGQAGRSGVGRVRAGAAGWGRTAQRASSRTKTLLVGEGLVVVVVVCVSVCMRGGGGGRAGEKTVEGRKRENLGRFVLRGKAQPVGSLTKQLSRQGREREQVTYRENGCRFFLCFACELLSLSFFAL